MLQYDENLVQLIAAVDYIHILAAPERTYRPPDLVDGRVTKPNYRKWMAVMDLIFEKEEAAEREALASADEWMAICEEDLAEERVALKEPNKFPQTKTDRSGLAVEPNQPLQQTNKTAGRQCQ
jgi:hypothetical protein